MTAVDDSRLGSAAVEMDIEVGSAWLLRNRDQRGWSCPVVVIGRSYGRALVAPPESRDATWTVEYVNGEWTTTCGATYVLVSA